MRAQLGSLADTLLFSENCWYAAPCDELVRDVCIPIFPAEIRATDPRVSLPSHARYLKKQFYRCRFGISRGVLAPLYRVTTITSWVKVTVRDRWVKIKANSFRVTRCIVIGRFQRCIFYSFSCRQVLWTIRSDICCCCTCDHFDRRKLTFPESVCPSPIWRLRNRIGVCVIIESCLYKYLDICGIGGTGFCGFKCLWKIRRLGDRKIWKFGNRNIQKLENSNT